MAKKKCWCDFEELTEADFGELTEADFGTEMDLLKAMQLTDEDLKKGDKLLENLGETVIITKGDKNKMKENLLNMDEASEFLGLRKSTLYGLCMRKEIPCVKIGKLNRFRPAALAKWIEAHEQGNT